MSAVGGNSIPIYLADIRNESATAAKAEAGNGSVQSAVSHFKSVAATIGSPAQLLGDYRSLTVVLGAFGLSSMMGETAILKKLMTQDPTAATSLAKTSNNPAWQKFAAAMSTWTDKQTPFTSATNVGTLASAFVTSSFETQQGSQYPGLGEALYFTRNAVSITSVTGLMADSTLLNVVETDAGLDPDQFGALDYDQQKAIITKDVDLKDYATSKGVQRLAEQYLALTGENGTTATAPSGVLALFASTTGDDSLMSIIGASLSSSA